MWKGWLLVSRSIEGLIGGVREEGYGFDGVIEMIAY